MTYSSRSIGPILLPKLSANGFNFGSKHSQENFPIRFNKWEVWLRTIFPVYVKANFGVRHQEFWAWVDSIKPGMRPPPFVAIWPRGGAKSTSAELAVVRMGARRARKYVWYVSSSQAKADMHVSNIGALLESPKLEKFHPALANRALGKFGAVKGWRRNRLRTASGLTVDALGLDVGARGSKVEESRPDMIVFDDIDEKSDSAALTLKKIDTMTATLLPAGSTDVAVLFVQNLIHQDSIASRLVDGRADFLIDRIVSGPHKAVDDLVVEKMGGRYVITGGRATWDGQSLETCQTQIFTWGYTAFLTESQHEVENLGGIWQNIDFQRVMPNEVPKIRIVVAAVDPAVTSSKNSDSQGIQIDGIGYDNNIYRFFSHEAVSTPRAALKLAMEKAISLGARELIVETNQGGDLWENEYRYVAKELLDAATEPITIPLFEHAKASASTGSKEERNSRMYADYETGRVKHVIGTHTVLEKALLRFPNDPVDLADAAYWSWNRLRNSAAAFSFDYQKR